MVRKTILPSPGNFLIVFLTVFFCLAATVFRGQEPAGRAGKKRNRQLPHPPALYEATFSAQPAIVPAALMFPSPWPPLYDTIKIVFIGDVMQHGYQIRSALTEGKDRDDPASYDYSRAFKYVEKFFRNADLSVANMEFPLGITPYTGYPNFSAPPSIARQAKESGLGLFQLANNHLMDKGVPGLEKTLAIYDTLGVLYTGAYRNREEERRKNPAFVMIKGMKFAFINFTYGTNGNPVPPPYVINLMDSLHVKEVIGRAKEKGADMIIALPHWGTEYQLYPSAQQEQWARMLFRNGVQIIIGTHPHVPQSGEIHYVRGQLPSGTEKAERIVFYSLGNYITNQSIPDYTQLELLVEIRLVKNNITRELVLIDPQWTYLWCFKKDEFETDYTVVPVEELLEHPGKVKKRDQYERMLNTYRDLVNKNLIKRIYY